MLNAYQTYCRTSPVDECTFCITFSFKAEGCTESTLIHKGCPVVISRRAYTYIYSDSSEHCCEDIHFYFIGRLHSLKKRNVRHSSAESDNDSISRLKLRNKSTEKRYMCILNKLTWRMEQCCQNLVQFCVVMWCAPLFHTYKACMHIHQNLSFNV